MFIPLLADAFGVRSLTVLEQVGTDGDFLKGNCYNAAHKDKYLEFVEDIVCQAEK